MLFNERVSMNVNKYAKYIIFKSDIVFHDTYTWYGRIFSDKNNTSTHMQVLHVISMWHHKATPNTKKTCCTFELCHQQF